MNRISKENYYLNIAQECLKRGTCLRRNHGAIIVKNDEIISTGYTGSPRGRPNCSEIGKCLREELNIPSGERYELCRSVHAEMNACIHASRQLMYGGILYLVGWDMKTNSLAYGTMCCDMCKRVIINAGLSKVIIRRTTEYYDTYLVSDWALEGKQ